MYQNDSYRLLFDLPPYILGAIVWLWGFGSLVFYGWRTKTLRSVVLKNPAILIGDFFILPAIAFLISVFYQTIENPLLQAQSTVWTISAVITAAMLTIISAVRYKLFNLWFLPHMLFYWFFAYLVLTFLTKGLYQLIFGSSNTQLWILWIAVFIGIVLHQLLGIFYPKKFPRQQYVFILPCKPFFKVKP